MGGSRVHPENPFSEMDGDEIRTNDPRQSSRPMRLIERAFGKPREYDPTAKQAQQKPTFDPSLYTIEELETLQAELLLMARRQGLFPPEEGEDVAG
jgi:hypothetical protein